MAEAVVDSMETDTPHYFCHMCTCEITELTDEYACPLCNNGFVEQLPDTPAPTPVPPPATTHRNRRFPAANYERNPFNNMDDFNSVLHDFLVRIPFGQEQYFVVGDPNDYAWGNEGFDTIVTQMLNQMETSGPPPLSAEKIKDLAEGKITAENVAEKLQCSICWDDFILDEFVRKLPCAHQYHSGCIVPWLQLHDTCPVCRKAVNKEAPTQNTNAESFERIRLRFEDVRRAAAATRGDRQTNSDATELPSSSSRSNQNDAASSSSSSANANVRSNVFRFDDDQFNLD